MRSPGAGPLGLVEEAVAAYQAHDRVVAADSKPAATLALLQDWWTAFQEAEQDPAHEVIVLAARRAEVDRLNTACQELLAARGRLGAERLQVEDRRLRVGDRVVCGHNAIGGLGVANGSRGIVTGLDPHERTLTLRLGGDDGRTVMLPQSYLDGRGRGERNRRVRGGLAQRTQIRTHTRNEGAELVDHPGFLVVLPIEVVGNSARVLGDVLQGEPQGVGIAAHGRVRSIDEFAAPLRHLSREEIAQRPAAPANVIAGFIDRSGDSLRRELIRAGEACQAGADNTDTSPESRSRVSLRNSTDNGSQTRRADSGQQQTAAAVDARLLVQSFNRLPGGNAGPAAMKGKAQRAT